jgi:hypothetical protein
MRDVQLLLRVKKDLASVTATFIRRIYIYCVDKQIGQHAGQMRFSVAESKAVVARFRPSFIHRRRSSGNIASAKVYEFQVLLREMIRVQLDLSCSPKSHMAST